MITNLEDVVRHVWAVSAGEVPNPEGYHFDYTDPMRLYREVLETGWPLIERKVREQVAREIREMNGERWLMPARIALRIAADTVERKQDG